MSKKKQAKSKSTVEEATKGLEDVELSSSSDAGNSTAKEALADATTEATTGPTEVAAAAAADTEDAPPLPTRPPSAIEKAVGELKETFPGIDEKYIKTALIASGGYLAPVFNALLYLSDPTSDVPIPTPREGSPEPPRAERRIKQQVEADEAYARSLAKKYGGKTSKAPSRSNNVPSWYKEGDDNDIDEIYDQISKNVEQVRTKFGGWVDNLTKKIQQPEESVPVLPRRKTQDKPLPKEPVAAPVKLTDATEEGLGSVDPKPVKPVQLTVASAEPVEPVESVEPVANNTFTVDDDSDDEDTANATTTTAKVTTTTTAKVTTTTKDS